MFAVNGPDVYDQTTPVQGFVLDGQTDTLLEHFGANSLVSLTTAAVSAFHMLFVLNPLRAKFFRGNINIYLHFMSFLRTGTTQVLKILTQVR